MVCILCGGQGHFNAFGACGEGEKLGACPLCHGSKVSAANLTVKCTPCDGKSGTGAFGPALPFDTHYRVACLACEGKGYHPTGTILTPCGSCGGQGAEGAFGHCTPGDTNVKSLCGACHGKGCTVSHAPEQKVATPAPAPTPSPTPAKPASGPVDITGDDEPHSVIKIAAKVYFHQESDHRVFAGRTLFAPATAGHYASRIALAAEDFDAKELGFEYKVGVCGATSTNYTHDWDEKAYHNYPDVAGLVDHAINAVNVKLAGTKAAEYTVKYQVSREAAGGWSAVAHDGTWARTSGRRGGSRIKLWVEKK